MTTNIEFIEINPELPPIASIIWLHGLGADGNDFAPVARELMTSHALPPLRFILPHAPFQAVTLNQGYVMRAWYDILSLEPDRRADEAGIKKSIHQITRLIEQEIVHGMASNRIFLAGFSQGAVIATATALHHPEPLGGVIALSGYIPWAEETLRHLPTANARLPIFIGHGMEDDIVPVALGQRMYHALKSAGLPVIWHEYPMPHSVCAKEVKDIAAWLSRHLQ